MKPQAFLIRILLPALALGAFALPAACASSPARPSQGSARIKDTVPERVAAQRAAQKDLNLEGEDERWGIEAARERKERARTDSGASSSAPAAPGSSGPGAEGPADLRQTAPPPSHSSH